MVPQERAVVCRVIQLYNLADHVNSAIFMINKHLPAFKLHLCTSVYPQESVSL